MVMHPSLAVEWVWQPPKRSLWRVLVDGILAMVEPAPAPKPLRRPNLPTVETYAPPPPPPNEPEETLQELNHRLAQATAEINATVPKIDPLGVAKAHIRSFNYGQMKEYCLAIGADMDKVWDWANADQA